ncbi:MAG TPA: hypothetical protein PLI77_04775, partial [Bacteroidales bacterium]|nr:hypothetical protein [Bacteroidales bacterium]
MFKKQYKNTTLLVVFRLLLVVLYKLLVVNLGIPAPSDPQSHPAAVGLRPVLLVSLQGSDRPGSSFQGRSTRSVIPYAAQLAGYLAFALMR